MNFDPRASFPKKSNTVSGLMMAKEAMKNAKSNNFQNNIVASRRGIRARRMLSGTNPFHPPEAVAPGRGTSTMNPRPTDFTPIIDLAGRRGAGPVRTQRPRYVDLLPPCSHACPAGEDIQGWLSHAQAGRYHEAWLTLVRDNPLPGVHGRVCYHPCETSCNRQEIDSAVSIHAVERFLGDRAIEGGWRLPMEAPPSGKRVLVVGAGPSGLSAAYHLARRGHAVDIRDAASLPGGMMRFGIPAYRLPREDLMREIRQIEALGVTVICNHKVDDLLAEKAEGGFDAIFVAIGAHVSKHIDIPARDAAKVMDAISLLRGVAAGETPRLGRRVAIYGGGDTAIDAARTARRLGAEDALIVYPATARTCRPTPSRCRRPRPKGYRSAG